MVGQKRRKADGVFGFISDAINDQQKAHVQTQRLEAKARQAWAKENAKVAAVSARDKTKQAQRQAREQEIALAGLAAWVPPLITFPASVGPPLSIMAAGRLAGVAGEWW
jgi:hypothetical protein